MQQQLLFTQKPILEVLKPIRFINGKWQISTENKKVKKNL